MLYILNGKIYKFLFVKYRIKEFVKKYRQIICNIINNIIYVISIPQLSKHSFFSIHMYYFIIVFILVSIYYFTVKIINI